MVKAKSGSVITECMGCVFTGDQDSVSGAWIIDIAPSGGRIDGVTATPVPDDSDSDDSSFVPTIGYPQGIRVSGSIAANDNLAAAGDGTFRIAGGGDVVSALAIASDIGGTFVLAVLYPPTP